MPMAFVPLLVTPDPSKAVRPGVVYTMTVAYQLTSVLAAYICYATRGFEYSRATQTVEIKRRYGGTQDVYHP